MSAQSFWDKAAPLIAVTEKHPFLVAMVDGTLALSNFQYYVVQDAHYLADYADCLRRLSKNEGVSESDSKRLEAFATGAAECEMSLHNSFFVEWKIASEGVEQMPNCLLYTSYMKRIVATRPHAEGKPKIMKGRNPSLHIFSFVGLNFYYRPGGAAAMLLGLHACWKMYA